MHIDELAPSKTTFHPRELEAAVALKPSAAGTGGFTRAFASIAIAFACNAVAAQASLAATAPSKALLTVHAEMKERLVRNAYGRPLFLESTETKGTISGDAYAVLDAPFETVTTAFKSPSQWCEVMILHINTKYCRARSDAIPSSLKVNIGKKTPQELSDTFALEFSMKLSSAGPDYLSILLNADQGPVGTSNYRIEFEATPLSAGKTFMHMRYSYGYGLAGRLAMQGYLATLGSGKVGFTTTSANEKTSYVDGMRGAVERNTMRYYLAIEAYLASQDKPVPQQPSTRFEHWFDATEQYSLQLHEVDKSAYLRMKKAEYLRQAQPVPGRG